MHLLTVVLLFVLSGCKNARSSDSLNEEAESYIRTSYTRTQELSNDGKLLGNLLFAMVDGKADSSELFDSAIVAFEQRVDVQIKELSDSEPPKVQGVSEYRELLVDYLTWQRSGVTEPMRNTVPIASDQNLSRTEREQKVMGLISSLAAEELAWERRLNEVIKEVYVQLN